MAAHEHEPPQHHGHVHLDEADWQEWADQTEREGELLLAFVTGAMRWATELRGPDSPPVRRVIDIGSGPGVGTCELARLFPDAHVTAVDASPAMLDRVRQRAAGHGLDERISPRLAELPGGLDRVEPAEMIWASMALHHVGDEIAALGVLRGLLEPSGLLVIAEFAAPAETMRVLPDELDVGRPGLTNRLEGAREAWFAAMREGLGDRHSSADLSAMLSSAGFERVGSRLAHQRLDPPLSEEARRVVLGHLLQTRKHLDAYLDDDDLRTLDVLTDSDDARSVVHRSDVYLAASRQIVIARASSGARHPDEPN